LSRDSVLLLGALAIGALTYAVVIATIYIGGGRSALRHQWRLLLVIGTLAAVLLVVGQSTDLLSNPLLLPLVLFLSIGTNVVLFAWRRPQSEPLTEQDRERRRTRLREVRGPAALLLAIYAIGVAVIVWVVVSAAR
jgi:uncharacterized protein (DUF2062 family)